MVGARSHRAANAPAASSSDQAPPKTSTALTERAPTASATANSSSMPKAKMRSVSIRRDPHVGGTGEPVPGRVDLGHREAVVAQHGDDVGVTPTLGPCILVVAAPQRDGVEAPGPGGGQSLAERDAGTQRARAEHGLVRDPTSWCTHYRCLRARERYRNDCPSPRAPAAPVSRLVLRGATVLDADGARPRSTLVIEDRRIATIRSGSDAGTVETATRRTASSTSTGAPSCPAWSRSHFHATYHELGSKAAPFGLEEPPALQAVRAAHHLELVLRCGFTGVVSAGAPFAHRRVHEGRHRRGAVPRATPHGRQPRRQHDRPRRRQELPVVLGRRRTWRRSIAADGPDEFRRAVREEIKQGAEIIKMFVTGGHGTVAPG